MQNYCSLHNHTYYSLMDSIIKPESLFKRAKELGQSSIAITDHSTLAGAWDGLQFSKKHGVKLIMGCEFYFTDDLEDHNKKLRHVILLAKNHQGYKNLLLANKLANDNFIIGFKKVIPRIDWNILEKCSEGLICTTACGSGILGHLINTRQKNTAKIEAKRLKDIFGENLAFEIQPHALRRNASDYNDYEDQSLVNNTLIKFGKDLDVKVIAATNAHYLTKEKWEAHDTWVAMGTHMPVKAVSRLKYSTHEFYIKSRDEVEDFFRRLYKDKAAEFCDNTLYFADMCEEPKWISPHHSNDTDNELPKFPVEDQKDYIEYIEWLQNQSLNIKEAPNDHSYYRYLSYKGLKEKVPTDKYHEYKIRLDEELDVLEYRDFCSYMCIVSDIMQFCRDNKIATSPARGSAAGCLAAYLTNIHQVDSIKYGLIFARFHNKYKAGLPDVDLDIASDKRDLVKQYIRDKYGAENVAHISNLNTVTPKVYARDIARAYQFGGDQKTSVTIGTDIADAIPADIKKLSKALIDAPLFMEYANHPDYIQLSKFADDLDGLPKVWSTHAGGVIIGKRPLHEIVPLRRDKDGNIVIEYEKERTEENGLVKIDLLCISTLDIIVKTLLLIDKSGKISPKDDIIDYDRNDDKTYALISIGDTLGVFQLGGSAGTMDICKKIKPKNIEDLAIINALARPNAAKIRQPFVETRDSGKIAKPIHESLHNAFAPTLGYAVFEEVLMNVAKDSAGWDLHDADKLRKLTKLKGKYPEKVAKWREEFIEGAVNNKNISKNMAARIWDEVISSFGGYAFNKSLYFLQEVDIYTKEGKFSKTTSIKNVNVGDWVLSRDEDLKKDILVQVTGKHDHGNLPLVEIELTTGEKVKCTINHKFRVEETGTMLPLWIILEKNLTIVVKGVTNGIKLS